MKTYLLILSFLFLQIFAGAQGGWDITATSRDNYDALTMANGMIGLLPSEKPFQFKKVVLNGVYDRYGKWGGGVSNIVQGIDFMNLDIQVDGSKSVRDATDAQLKDWKQILNMKEAFFTTSFIYDNKIKVSYTVYALRHLPYNALMTVSVTALQDVELSVSNTFINSESATITNTNFEKIENTIPLASALATSPTGKIKLAAANCFLFYGDSKPDITAQNGTDNNNRSFKKSLKKGETFQFALNGAICTSVQFPDPINESKRFALYAHLEGTDKLIAKHKAAWDTLWKSDIDIEGDDEAQQDVHFALYNLYSFVREGTAYSLSPMGMSGTGYNGHAFWDCETWMFPVLVLLHPEIAKSLLEYRFQRLQAAKRNAFSHGYKGAMFPWESADDGTEETPIWALTGPFEHHITSDIGMAFWNYYLVTKDTAWLKEKGFPVIKEVADFWVSRTEKNDKGEYEIKNVVCADEYAENVDNNAFTNGGAIVSLRNAVKAANELGIPPDPQWSLVAVKIPIRYFADSVVKEYETYNGQTIKQADANLLSYPLHLIPSSKLDKLNLDYYEPRVDKKDGPAMTYSIFSIISSRLGEPMKALEYFKQAYTPNKRPPFGVLAETATSNNPYFCTGAGGMLQAVLYGFAGIEITDHGIRNLKTMLPKEWKLLGIKGVGINKMTMVIIPH